MCADAARAHKRVDTCGFPPLVYLPFPLEGLAQTRDRRPLRKRERQSGYRCVSFVKYSQFTDSVLLHIRSTLRRARHNSAAQFFVCCNGRHLRTGCERYGRKNPLPFPLSKRSPVSGLRQANKQGKGRSSKRKENRRLSFLFVPAADAAISRASQSATPR